jgi:hypothetical protein
MKVSYTTLFGLLLPWALASLFSDNPKVSYLIAWIGHWLIFYFTLSGKVIPIKTGSIRSRVMEPIVINQIIFAGFSGISTIFYFLSINGFYYLTPIEFFIEDSELVRNTAECQRLYIIGHWGLIAGIVLGKKPEKSLEWTVKTGNSPSLFLLFISGISFVIFLALRSIQGLNQVAIMFDALNLVSSILALAFAVKEKNILTIAIALTLFGVNISSALISGWKEQLLVPFLLLFFFLYQSYPKTVLLGAPILGFLYFTYIPTFNQTFRSLTWEKGEDAQIALQIAITGTLEANTEEINQNNWTFLTNRLSEVNMLIKYKEFVPKFHAYYGFQILQQSVINLIPRILYKDKPITESMVMQRVFEAGVVSNISNVSAKPAYIADCYLTAGSMGVLLGTMVLGYIISFASGYADKLFGGYTFGTSLMYNSIFNELWRGNCFEFMSTTIFWGLIILFIVHRVSRYANIIQPKDASAPEISLS